MKQEIIFFEDQNAETGNRPPHDGSHTACGTPNPPWWCEDNPNSTNIDMGLFFLIFIGLILLIFVNYETRCRGFFKNEK